MIVILHSLYDGETPYRISSPYIFILSKGPGPQTGVTGITSAIGVIDAPSSSLKVFADGGNGTSFNSPAVVGSKNPNISSPWPRLLPQLPDGRPLNIGSSLASDGLVFIPGRVPIIIHSWRNSGSRAKPITQEASSIPGCDSPTPDILCPPMGIII